MDDAIIIEIKADVKGFERQVKSALDKAVEQSKRFSSALDNSNASLVTVRRNFDLLRASASAFAAIGVARLFENIARASISAAISVDRQISSLKALTGSAEAAQRRFQELFRLAQQTPGLTTSLATTLDAQLRIFRVSEQTINKLLPVVGRLNAISPLGDPRQFVNNLTQLISQNFDRADLKELVGQSPLAGQLISRIFNVDNPTNAEAIRKSAQKLGITTVERLAESLVKEAANNPALKNAQETLGGQFEKIKERAELALAPIGAEIAKNLIPTFEKLIPIAEDFGKSLSRYLADNGAQIAKFRDSVVDLTSAFASLGKISIPILGDLLRTAANGVAFYADLGDAIKGDFSFKRSKGNFGNLIDSGPIVTYGPDLAPAAAQLTPEQQKLAAKFPFRRNFEIQSPGSKTDLTKTRARSVADRGLSVSDLVSSELEGLADFNAAQSAIFAGRVRRQELTAAFESTERKDQLAQGRLTRKALTEDFEQRAEALKKLQPVLSNSQRLMLGFASSIETTGDAFERLGQNIADSFRNVGSLLTNLKNSLLSFFNDLLGSSLQRVFGQVLAPIAAMFGGGGNYALPGGPNLFRSSNISTPGSVTEASQFRQLISGLTGGEITGGTVGGTATRARTVTGATSTGFSLSAFGKSIGAAAPFLGITAGIGAGGQSRLGQIAGAAGGLIAGGAVGIATHAITNPAIIGLYANPFTIPIAAALLVGSIFAGKAAQRRKDEEASGQYLTQALDSIAQLKAAVDAGQITDLGQARSIFETQILGTFRQQISGLKTASVRESRLTNQVRDLRQNFEDLIPPSINAALARQSKAQQNALNFSRQIPEFASGGYVGGINRGYDSVTARLTPGELVLNRAQQSAVMAQSSPSVFRNAGVPAMNTSGRYAEGGYVASGQQSGAVVIENLTVGFMVGKNDASRVFVAGGTTKNGRAVVVNNVKVARTNREL